MTLLIAMAMLVGGGALAQDCPNPGVNEICIVFDYPGDCCQNGLFPAPMGQTVMGYIVVHNPDSPGGIGGFEFQVCNPLGADFAPPAGCFVTAWSLPPGGINVYDPPVFAVGLPSAMPLAPCVVMVEMAILVYCADCWCFGVRPLDTPSVPDQMVYADGVDPGLLVQMHPCVGPYADSCEIACIGCATTPVGTEDSSWGNLKTLYR
jgi:hypothetical protein